MDIYHEKKKLALSKEQVDAMGLEARFNIEKERLEKKIQREIETQGDICINNVDLPPIIVPPLELES